MTEGVLTTDEPTFGGAPARAGVARTGAWPRLALTIVRALLRMLFRVRLEGVFPTEGPYLLVANHQGWADAFLILAVAPTEPRIYFLGDRAATMRSWWKRTLLRSLGVVVTVDRGRTSDPAAIGTVLRLLRGGAAVGLFPEGRVSHAEHDLAPFRRGVGYLALKAGVPVVPVWLTGTAELYLGRELVARVGTGRLPPDAPAGRDATEAFAGRLHDDLLALARPWVEPVGVRKRMRWLTDIL